MQLRIYDTSPSARLMSALETKTATIHAKVNVKLLGERRKIDNSMTYDRIAVVYIFVWRLLILKKFTINKLLVSVKNEVS